MFHRFICWTGPIPKELGALSKLFFLWLDGNNLSGEQPKKMLWILEPHLLTHAVGELVFQNSSEKIENM